MNRQPGKHFSNGGSSIWIAAGKIIFTVNTGKSIDDQM